eukprot:11754185-Heterocapsa_arctica.AAC.1
MSGASRIFTGLWVAITIILAMGFIPASFVIYLVHEKATSGKHQREAPAAAQRRQPGDVLDLELRLGHDQLPDPAPLVRADHRCLQRRGVRRGQPAGLLRADADLRRVHDAHDVLRGAALQ